MSTDSRIDSDLKALAESSADGLPTHDQTARALSQARAQQQQGGLMKSIRKPIYVTAAGLAAVAAVLIFPVPYSRTVGYDLKVAKAGGQVATLHVHTRNGAAAEQRAALLRKSGTTVTVEPRTERVWGSVFAMAKEKLLHINVDFDGKTDEEVAADIRRQLDEAGWNAGEVQVKRADGVSTVEIGADDGNGRKMKIVRSTSGGAEKNAQVEVGALDDSREPGMTDAQLRDKIVKQLKARGMDGDVQVEGNRIEIRASHRAEVEE
ncbi:MAG: hypothetical protein JWN44_2775 [Myxococcales bacterium]|nr:hypothetical protein [Myxococcales bacterium]